MHHGGKTGEYFGEVKDSYIEYYVNPEYPFDKVFDNISYRGDVFDTTGDYLPKETFEKMIVSNEFQTGERLLKGVTGTSDWRAKKYRIWEFAFPRQISSLNRIRNPWVKLKLLFNNEHGYSFVLHDLVVKYSV
ncbi:MAG: hypothetical protein LBE56_12745 [Tannerella sp.]|nr:hypothetical protein [Tannerella sp.]